MYWRLSCTILLILLAGCSHQQPKVEPPPAIAKEAPPKHVVVVKPTAALSEVAILVSSDIPAYRGVADAIGTRLGARAKTWQLPGTLEGNARTLSEISKSQRQQIVAVGLDAAVMAKKLDDRQVIFCQVFNYEDHHLPSPLSKGVSMLPSFTESFAAWKAISPSLKRIAIITGPGLNDYVREAREAAKEKGIDLIHREVDNDKELLVVYKSIADSVQGYWLWPDNRVLSGVVLRDVLTFSMRSGKQVVVFNDELLELGGLISITSKYNDIANKVVERLAHADGKTIIPGEVIEPLDKAHLRINPVMAERFDLNVPGKYRKYLDAQ